MANIQIIHGRDNFFILEKKKNFLKLIPQEFREFCYLKYFGHEVVDEALLGEVATPPFGCEHKLVMVEEYQKFKNKNLIYRLIEECSPACFLLLISSDTKTLGAKLKKTVMQHKNKVNFVLLKTLRARDLKQRIAEYLKQHQFQFEEGAVTYMAEQLQNQPEFLKEELEKLNLLLISNKKGDKEVFTEKIARSFLSIRDEDSVFKIIEYILTRNKIKALKSLNTYLNLMGNFILLQTMLQSETYKLLKFMELSSSGVTEKEIFFSLGISNWFSKQQEIKKMSEVFSLTEVYSLLASICELERILKSESITNENRDSIKVNLLAKNWLLKIISVYCR